MQVMSLDDVSFDDICKLNPLAAEWHPTNLTLLSTRISNAQGSAEYARSKDAVYIEACLDAWELGYSNGKKQQKWPSSQVSPIHQHATGAMSEMPCFGNGEYDTNLKELPDGRKAGPTPPSPAVLDPAILLGSWTDSKGNAVMVFSVDAYEVRLMATLSRHPRQDVNLKLRQLPDGGWACGNAVLDLVQSTSCQLHWVSPSHYSVWDRPCKAGDDMLIVTERL